MSDRVSLTECLAEHLRLGDEAQVQMSAASLHDMLVAEDVVERVFGSLCALGEPGVRGEVAALVCRLIKDASLLNSIGNRLFSQGQARLAVSFYDAAFRAKPRDPRPLKRKGNALRVLGEVEEAVQAYRQALAIRYDAGLHSRMLLAMHYSNEWTAQQLAEEHFSWGNDPSISEPVTVTQSAGFSEKPVFKIGYLSPDFRSHPVSYFFQPILINHDRGRFHVTCYSTQSGEDGVTRRIKSACDVWREVDQVGDKELTAQIRADDIDILIDLAGHTGGNRLEVFQGRAAPVQITYLGYPNGTGLRQMDYRLTDEVSDPLGRSEHLYAEQLIRMSPCFLTFEPPGGSPGVSVSPCTVNGFVTFGSFNKFSKLSDECIEAWVDILNKVPTSRLFLKTGGLDDPGEKQKALSRFSRAGLEDTARVEIHDLVPSRTDHLRLYERIDIALDPFPYNGTTTTCQALWMGVPVVSLKGDRHVSRVGASILSQMNLQMLVADSKADYTDIAARLANAPQDLPMLRESIRPRLLESPLLDHVGFTRQLESIFQSLWVRGARSVAAK